MLDCQLAKDVMVSFSDSSRGFGGLKVDVAIVQDCGLLRLWYSFRHSVVLVFDGGFAL